MSLCPARPNVNIAHHKVSMPHLKGYLTDVRAMTLPQRSCHQSEPFPMTQSLQVGTGARLAKNGCRIAPGSSVIFTGGHGLATAAKLPFARIALNVLAGQLKRSRFALPRPVLCMSFVSRGDFSGR